MNIYCNRINKKQSWLSNLVETTRYQHLLFRIDNKRGYLTYCTRRVLHIYCIPIVKKAWMSKLVDTMRYDHLLYPY